MGLGSFRGKNRYSELNVQVAELKAQQELLGETDSMPGNCCTIITWSCAVLRFFRPNLFTALARVAAGKLQAGLRDVWTPSAPFA